MYTVASPDPDTNTRGGGQLPNPNECNSALTSVTGGFPLPLYYNRWNSSPMQKSARRSTPSWIQR